MLKFIRKYVKNESGATAIEYGLIAALVSVAAVVALQALGTSLNDMFTTVSTTLDSATTSAGGGGTPTP
ncbi:MAG: Flp family type IVb pilin [Alphaproteobacteria bacterium]|nr:Flp family type IVb pilin [Alphaproteobacteria bacterium]